jgi:twitching motility protein PilT
MMSETGTISLLSDNKNLKAQVPAQIGNSFAELLPAPAPSPATEPFHKILFAMLSASDRISNLIFSPGRPPQVEVGGDLYGVQIEGLEMIKPEHTDVLAKVILRDRPTAIKELMQEGAADGAYGLPGQTRFRVNIFRQRGTNVIVMRNIPMIIPTLDELQMPKPLKKISELESGLVMIGGKSGSGKSSTMAAIVDLINETRRFHIITIEDPIEFLHKHKRSTIHQRELHTDTQRYSTALRTALRQAPKVIVVGEIRDPETFETVLEAAETGHLVLSTIHALDVSKVVERVLSFFPKSEECSIRTRLAQSFRFILGQRLVPRTDRTGIVPIVEILKTTARTRDYIEHGEREGKTLVGAMRSGDLEGMQCFDQVLEQYAQENVITTETALAYATDRAALQLKLVGYPAENPSDEQTPVPSSPPASATAAKPSQTPHFGSLLDKIQRL